MLYHNGVYYLHTHCNAWRVVPLILVISVKYVVLEITPDDSGFRLVGSLGDHFNVEFEVR